MSDYKTENRYKTKKSSRPGRTVNTQYNPPKGLEEKRRRHNMLVAAKKSEMPKARDMAMGDKNISYVGDPFVVDGKKFDPAKKFPETYMRPEGAKTFKKGGMARGGGAAIKGTKFQGVF